ncbi:outer membrane protein homolog [Hyphomonas neptunium ATCC 15444]|uniref:Outer membrane protein homolog n=2 Tax=Hyphomonas TaxID=85 RepID=Q0C3E8_HYPNA|nr:MULTISPECIES: SIMPL domain-containing protein [Hyphomonas]ABI78764.1 outer membrane protein homolog [Hyphomonas neptunium ATCC 15444]KCZ96046.1 outer membrane protein [Hyphomonas hirschiana VP5]
MKHLTLSAVALVMALAPAACAQGASAYTAPAGSSPMAHPNSIQPETTLQISAEARVDRAPDIAFVTAGVTEERATASEAMAAQSAAMNGVFEALRAAGIADRDMQTSGLSLQPRYDYVETADREGVKRGVQKLAGYVASNQVTVRVRDLARLGDTLDSLVSSGGNTLSGVNFAIDDDKEVRNEARSKAMKDAIAKAELYASASGLRVARIVTISEGYEHTPQPMPMARMAMASDMMESTPVAGGEVGVTANVSVLFELTK